MSTCFINVFPNRESPRSGGAHVTRGAGEVLRAGQPFNLPIRFTLPAGARDVRLVSRVWVPAWMQPESDDTRPLGVCVRWLVLDGRDVALDAAALADGWHPVEGDAGASWRWTRGSARLPEGAATITVETTGTHPYWSRSPRRAWRPRLVA